MDVKHHERRSDELDSENFKPLCSTYLHRALTGSVIVGPMLPFPQIVATALGVIFAFLIADEGFSVFWPQQCVVQGEGQHTQGGQPHKDHSEHTHETSLRDESHKDHSEHNHETSLRDESHKDHSEHNMRHHCGMNLTKTILNTPMRQLSDESHKDHSEHTHETSVSDESHKDHSEHTHETSVRDESHKDHSEHTHVTSVRDESHKGYLF